MIIGLMEIMILFTTDLICHLAVQAHDFKYDIMHQYFRSNTQRVLYVPILTTNKKMFYHISAMY